MRKYTVSFGAFGDSMRVENVEAHQAEPFNGGVAFYNIGTMLAGGQAAMIMSRMIIAPVIHLQDVTPPPSLLK